MAATTWNLDPAHSEVNFRVRHMMVASASGKFKNFTSNVSTNGDDFTTANIDFSVETGSIDTGMEMRDNHLRSDDFFNSEQFPKLSFKDSGIKRLGDHEFQLDGDLTIRDITKPVSFRVEYGGTMNDPYGNLRAGFEVTGAIHRKDFGLTWNALTEAGGAVVSDDVKFSANLQYVRPIA